MTAPRRVPVIDARGAPYVAGYAHGRARAAQLRAFLDDDLTRLGRLLTGPVTLAGLRPTLYAHAEVIAAALPELSREIEGLAAGAGISHEEAVLLQLRREILGYHSVRPPAGDCTVHARGGPDAVLVQTVDLNGDLADQIAVLEVGRPGSRSALVLSFGGLLGYLGMNSDGLAVGLNLVLAGRWRPGVPPYLAIRHLLDHAGDVAEAIEILRGLPLASSRTIVLCDATTAAYVEIVEDELRVVTADRVEHTNHYLHPDFVAGDEINPFARNSSVLRLTACRERMAALGPSTEVDEYFAALSDAPICVPTNGDVRREATVASVVLQPARHLMAVRPGNPALSATEIVPLDVLADNRRR